MSAIKKIYRTLSWLFSHLNLLWLFLMFIGAALFDMLRAPFTRKTTKASYRKQAHAINWK
jgi:hypothetical protein